ncbi:hypothetical protein FBU30_008304, partial [Linnemannia zychae]
MHKIALVLSALSIIQVAFAQTYSIKVFSSSGPQSIVFNDDRFCYCLSETDVGMIDGTNGGNVLLFGSNDCTGNYVKMPSPVITNAQWVKSVKFGRSSYPLLPSKTCK